MSCSTLVVSHNPVLACPARQLSRIRQVEDSDSTFPDLRPITVLWDRHAACATHWGHCSVACVASARPDGRRAGPPDLQVAEEEPVELSPFAIERVSFDVVRRGYDKGQVDGFVVEVAANFEQVTTRMREAESRVTALERRLAVAEERAERAEEVIVAGIDARLTARVPNKISLEADDVAATVVDSPPSAAADDGEVSFDRALRLAKELLAEYRAMGAASTD